MRQLSAADRLSRHGPAPIRLDANPLTVDVKTTLGLSPSDAALFNSLVERNPQTGVFASIPWLSGFFDDPPPGFEPILALLREGATVRGVVPLAVSELRTHVRVRLLGGGLGSDRVDMLATQGYEVACADAFVNWLSEAFDKRALIFELRSVPCESPIWGAVFRLNAERALRLALQPREMHLLPYLDLQDASTRLGRAPLTVSASLDKHRRWLERRGRLRIELLQETSEVLSAFDTLTGFLHTRWTHQSRQSVLDSPRTYRFHRVVIPRLLAAGQLRMIRLSSDMRTIGIFYGLANPGWWGYYLCGYDREWAGRIHLGRLTIAAAVDLATREGAKEFDFLEGVERVKYLWPVREHLTLDADLYSAGAGAQLKRIGRATYEAATAVVRSARGLLGGRG